MLYDKDREEQNNKTQNVSFPNENSYENYIDSLLKPCTEDPDQRREDG